jgi:hypothetical protein
MAEAAKIRRYALILLVVVIALAVWGEVSRVMARASLSKETAEAAVPTVVTVNAPMDISRSGTAISARR